MKLLSAEEIYDNNKDVFSLHPTFKTFKRYLAGVVYNQRLIVPVVKGDIGRGRKNLYSVKQAEIMVEWYRLSRSVEFLRDKLKRFSGGEIK